MTSNKLKAIADKFKSENPKLWSNPAAASAIPPIPQGNSQKTKAIIMGAENLFAILNYYLQSNNFVAGETYDQFAQKNTAEKLAQELTAQIPEIERAFVALKAAIK